MITIGVDLASRDRNTAIAELHWDATGAHLAEPVVPSSDTAILAAIRRADKAGLDVPLGWPDAFVTFLREHHEGHSAMPDSVDGPAWRRSLANRVTDFAVHERCRMTPLSVSTDKIAYPAMRAANLLAQLAAAGTSVDRAGRKTVVEVYPAASLRRWSLASRGYKGKDPAPLADLVAALLVKAPWLDLGKHRDLIARNDHAFDAVVAALTAWAAAHSRTFPPSTEQLAAAEREGWVAVPNGRLEDLWPIA